MAMAEGRLALFKRGLHLMPTKSATSRQSGMEIAERFLEACPDSVKVLDRDGHIISFNANGLAAMEVLDFCSLKGAYWPSIWPEALYGDAQQALEDAQTGQTGRFSGLRSTSKGTLKSWEVLVTAVPNHNGLPERLLVISRDVTAQRTQEEATLKLRDDLQRLSERMNTAAAATAEVLWDIDLATGQMWWSEGMFSVFGYGPGQVGSDAAWYHEHIHPEDRTRVTESMQAAHEEGATLWQGEFRYRKADGNYVHVADRGSIRRDASGRALRFMGAMEDISVRHAFQVQQKLLSDELAHRISNTLTIVQSLVRLTSKVTPDVPTFAKQLGARLAAMANASRSLMAGKWVGADFEELAATQLAPFSDDKRRRISLSGPTVSIGMGAAQALALALNELATNATKYGALSTLDGRVALTWTVDERGRMLLLWEERGGPPVTPPTRKGLGSVLIDHGIPRAVVERRFDPAGVFCSIEFAVSGG
jgi:PAS domain S-box-containing protein